MKRSRIVRLHIMNFMICLLREQHLLPCPVVLAMFDCSEAIDNSHAAGCLVLALAAFNLTIFLDYSDVSSHFPDYRSTQNLGALF